MKNLARLSYPRMVMSSSLELGMWKDEPPCRLALAQKLDLSFLVYWLSYQEPSIISNLKMCHLREWAATCESNHASTNSRPVLEPKKIAGFFNVLPGPKSPEEIRRLIRVLVSGLDGDAELVFWDCALNAAVLHEPKRGRLTVILRGTATFGDLLVDIAAVPWTPLKYRAGGFEVTPLSVSLI